MPLNRPYHSVVLVKQVPDTRNVTGDVMTAEGTMNRSALPAIFNPEDLNALEMALSIKDQNGGSVTVLTMGPMQAAEVLRESLFRGADRVILLSDRKFAGADTQATSYTLKCAVDKLGVYDLVFCGRQAIDGDTAQVGPQTAEKLGIPQITYAEKITDLKKNRITVRRRIDGGYEILESKLPVLLTVIKEAAEPRPFKARNVMAYKNAKSLSELEEMVNQNSLLYIDDLKEEFIARGLFIPTLTLDDFEIDETRIGQSGSPTKVYKVDSVVLGAGEHIKIEPTGEGINQLIDQLMSDRIFG